MCPVLPSPNSWMSMGPNFAILSSYSSQCLHANFLKLDLGFHNSQERMSKSLLIEKTNFTDMHVRPLTCHKLYVLTYQCLSTSLEPFKSHSGNSGHLKLKYHILQLILRGKLPCNTKILVKILSLVDFLSSQSFFATIEICLLNFLIIRHTFWVTVQRDMPWDFFLFQDFFHCLTKHLW